MAGGLKDTLSALLQDKYVTRGASIGTIIALSAALLRANKMNKFLSDLDEGDNRGDKHTVIVPVTREALARMNKSAQEEDGYAKQMYGRYASIGSGVASYLLITALLKKIEQHRLKKLEEKAYQNAVGRILSKNASLNKSAKGYVTSLLNAIGNANDEYVEPTRNVFALLTFLASALAFKSGLDKRRRVSDRLKPITPTKILIRAPETPSSNSLQFDKGASVNVDLPKMSGDLKKKLNKINAELEKNPYTQASIARAALDARGYSWVPHNIPILKTFINREVNKRIGLPPYTAGLRANSLTNSPAVYGPYRGIPKKKDMAAFGTDQIYHMILSDPDVKMHIVGSLLNSVDPKTLSDEKKLAFLGAKQLYKMNLMSDPIASKILAEVGIKPAPVKMFSMEDLNRANIPKEERLASPYLGSII